LKPKTVKKLPEWQAYARLYYDKKLKDIIEKKHEKEYIRKFPNSNRNKIPAPEFKWRNKEIRSHYEKEPESIKLEVRDYRDQLQAAGVSAADEDATEDELLEGLELEARKLARKYQS
jgi:hypothetical protein